MYSYGQVVSGADSDTFIRKVDVNQNQIWRKIINTNQAARFSFDVSQNEAHLFFISAEPTFLEFIQVNAATGVPVRKLKSTAVNGHKEYSQLVVSQDNLVVYFTVYLGKFSNFK